MKKVKRFLKNGGAFAILLLIMVYMFSLKFDIEKLVDIILECNPIYIALGFASTSVFLLCESINIRRGLWILGDKVSQKRCIKYAITGFFFSGITPAATGGQPMQAYYMCKDGIAVSHGTLALAMELVGYEFAAVVYGTIGLVTNHDLIFSRVDHIWFVVVIGLAINILLLVVVMVAVFSKSLVYKCIRLIERILRICRYKKVDMFCEKANHQLCEYRKCAGYVLENKGLIVRYLLTSLLEIGALHSVPFWVYKSFELHGYSFFVMLSLQAVLFVTVSILPVPGAIGVSEGGFLILFRHAFPKKIIAGAMFLSRGISFYVFVVLFGTVLGLYEIGNGIRHWRTEHKCDRKRKI